MSYEAVDLWCSVMGECFNLLTYFNDPMLNLHLCEVPAIGETLTIVVGNARIACQNFQVSIPS